MTNKEALAESTNRMKVIRNKAEALVKGIKDVTVTPYDVSKGAVAYNSDGKVEGTSPFVYESDSNGSLTYNVEFPVTEDLIVSASGYESKKLGTGVVVDDWVTVTGPSDSVEVAYGNGRFVRIMSSSSSSHSIAAYSNDGITWASAKLPASAKWITIAYGKVNGKGRFVAIATSSTSAAYSDDGITWTLATLPISLGYKNVIYGNGRFVSLAPYYGYVFYSDDGITWNEITGVLSDEYDWSGCCVAYGEVNGKGRFVALSSTVYTGTAGRGCYSDDGISWTEYDLPDFGLTTGTSASIAYGNGRFVANVAGATGNMYSDDGINWVYVSHSYCICGVTFGTIGGRGVFVARHNNYTCCYSEDGINWVKSFLPYTSGEWYPFVFGGERLLTWAPEDELQAYCDPKVELILSKS